MIMYDFILNFIGSDFLHKIFGYIFLCMKITTFIICKKKCQNLHCFYSLKDKMSFWTEIIMCGGIYKERIHCDF